jgi:hypothetical protein
MSSPAESDPRSPARRRWLVPVALAAAALLGSGYVLAPWWESPTETWQAVSAAAGDSRAVWDRMDPAIRCWMDPKLRAFAE